MNIFERSQAAAMTHDMANGPNLCLSAGGYDHTCRLWDVEIGQVRSIYVFRVFMYFPDRNCHGRKSGSTSLLC